MYTLATDISCLWAISACMQPFATTCNNTNSHITVCIVKLNYIIIITLHIKILSLMYTK